MFCFWSSGARVPRLKFCPSTTFPVCCCVVAYVLVFILRRRDANVPRVSSVTGCAVHRNAASAPQGKTTSGFVEIKTKKNAGRWALQMDTIQSCMCPRTLLLRCKHLECCTPTSEHNLNLGNPRTTTLATAAESPDYTSTSRRHIRREG